MVKVRESKLQVVLFGLCSMLGDVVYEGFKSIAYLLLAHGGLTLTLICVALSLGDMVLTASRIVGAALNLIVKPWVLYTVGYLLIGLLPLTSLARDPLLVTIMYVAERFGKGLRGPARDLAISNIQERPETKFLITEVLDQVGAVAGPCLTLLVYLLTGDVFLSICMLCIPYIVLVAICLYIILHMRYLFERTSSVQVGTMYVSTLSSARGTTSIVMLLCLPLLVIIPLPMAQYIVSVSTGYTQLGIVLYLLLNIMTIPSIYLMRALVERSVLSTCIITIAVGGIATLLPLAACVLNPLLLTVLLAVLLSLCVGFIEYVPRVVINKIFPDVTARKHAYTLYAIATAVFSLAASIYIPLIYVYSQVLYMVTVIVLSVIVSVLLYARFRKM